MNEDLQGTPDKQDGSTGTPAEAGSQQGRRGRLGHIDQYTLLERVQAQDAVWPTFRARDTTIGIDVTVHVVPPEVTDSSGALSALRDACYDATDVRHAGLARFLRLHTVSAVDEKAREHTALEEGDCLLVTELVEGQTVAAWRESLPDGRMPWPQALAVMQSVVGGLQAVHASGMVHGSITPDRIVVLPNGTAKLTHFGVDGLLGQAVEKVSGERDIAAAQLPYLAPDFLTTGRATAASDQFAVAVVLYELVSGRHPFADASASDLDALLQTLQTVVPEPVAAADAAANAALSRALRPVPAERFASCAEFLAELGAEVQTAPTATTATTDIPWGTVARVAAGLAVVLIGFRVMRSCGGGDAPDRPRVVQPSSPEPEPPRSPVDEAIDAARSHVAKDKLVEAWRALRRAREIDPEHAGLPDAEKAFRAAVGLADAATSRSDVRAVQEELKSGADWPGKGVGTAALTTALTRGDAASAKGDHAEAFGVYQLALQQAAAARQQQTEWGKAEDMRQRVEDLFKLAEETGFGTSAPAQIQRLRELADSARESRDRGEVDGACELLLRVETDLGTAMEKTVSGRFDRQLKDAMSAWEKDVGRSFFQPALNQAAVARDKARNKKCAEACRVWLEAFTALDMLTFAAQHDKDIRGIQELLTRVEELVGKQATAPESIQESETLFKRARSALAVIMKADPELAGKHKGTRELQDRTKSLEARFGSEAAEGQPWIVPSAGLHMCWVPSGRCQLGSPPDERKSAAAEGRGRREWYRDEGDGQLEAVLEQGFWLSTGETTVRQWTLFATATEHRTEAETAGRAWGVDLHGSRQAGWRAGATWRSPGHGEAVHEQHPVTCVSWNDAQAYCRWLTTTEHEAGRLPEGYEYRLPTEAEWEFGCRAGTRTPFWWGNDPDDARQRVNVAGREDSNGDGYRWVLSNTWVDASEWVWQIKFVDRRRNAYGLVDMLGNVWEWCLDDYNSRRPSARLHSGDGTRRVVRGGSFKQPLGSARCASRAWAKPELAAFDVGFRVCLGPALSADQQEAAP